MRTLRRMVLALFFSLLPGIANAQQAETEIPGVTAEFVELRLAGDALRLAVRFNNTGEVTAAIRSGEIAGGISASFRLTRIRLEDGDTINVLCNGRDENPSISSVWIADRDWVAANRDMALALIISELNAARWANSDKAGWIALAMEQIEGYTAEAGEIDYQNIVIDADNWPVNGGLDLEMCETTLATSFEFGAIDKEVACDEVVDASFQEEALAILGTQ